MRVRIHRGTKEIGGTCIELMADGGRLLLDLGLPLDGDPVVQEVATGKTALTINPDPRLIVFGFDADQKKGQLQNILNALNNADPNLAVYAAGDPSSAGGAFRPPAK